MLLHWGVCPSHVVHQDHCVRDLVQVHANRRLDVERDADATTVAGLGHFEVLTQVGRDEVRSVRYPEVNHIETTRTCLNHSDTIKEHKVSMCRSNLRLTTALEAISWSGRGNVSCMVWSRGLG